MRFGESVSKLIKVLRTGKSSDYCESLVKVIEHENEIVNSRMRYIREKIGEEDVTEEVSLNYMILKNFLNRNIRILRYYRFSKMIGLQDRLFKKVEAHTPQENQIYLRLKKALEARYAEFSFLDVYENEPPLDLYVQVITLEDCGVVMDGDEFIELKKNRLYFLRKKSVEHLINMKMVEIVK